MTSNHALSMTIRVAVAARQEIVEFDVERPDLVVVAPRLATNARSRRPWRQRLRVKSWRASSEAIRTTVAASTAGFGMDRSIDKMPDGR